jgi:hypothetical protein
MKLPPSFVTFAPTGPPAEIKPEAITLEAIKLPPEVGLKLASYLQQTPAQFLFSGSRAQLGGLGSLLATDPLWNAAIKSATQPAAVAAQLESSSPAKDVILAGLRGGANAVRGAAFPVTSGLKLHPLLKLPITPEAVPNPPSGLRPIPSSFVKVTQAVSLLDAFRELGEEIAKTHPGLDTPLDCVGFVVASPQAWNAMTTPGTKNRFEVFFAVGKTIVAFFKILADFIPGLTHAKPVAVWSGVIMKFGEQCYAVINKPETPTALPTTPARLRPS